MAGPRAAAQTPDLFTGRDHVGGAIARSQALFASGSAPLVILARSDLYADATDAAALAVLLDADILLTPSAQLPPQVLAEITRLGTTQVIVLGGSDAIGPAVLSSLRGAGLVVEVVAGDDRDLTAVEVFSMIESVLADRGAVSADGLDVILMDGWNDSAAGWDAASQAFALGTASGHPILLVHAGRLPDVVGVLLASDRVRSATIVGALDQGVVAQIEALVGDVTFAS